MTHRRKLIEVALPLDEINAQSAREKSIRHGHPSTLHLWWSRKPLATARCVLFAQLVDDPSNRLEEFRDKYRSNRLPEEQAKSLAEDDVTLERQRLHRIISDLADWNNLGDEKLWDAAREEIEKSCGGQLPAFLDPFAGGGSIPIEAQRLGLAAMAGDLNPVAVLLNKAMIEIPPHFAGQPPIHPRVEGRTDGWHGAEGLAEDILYYGQWIQAEAKKRIGHLYPKVVLEDSTEADAIAWIWARTVRCPNPMCGIELPLVNSWWLGRKKGKESYIVPTVLDGHVTFSIGHNTKGAPSKGREGTVTRQGAICLACDSMFGFEYIRTEGTAGRLGESLMAVATASKRSRHYAAPTKEHSNIASSANPKAIPSGQIPSEALGFRVSPYGFKNWSDLYTRRQLTTLTEISTLVREVRERVLMDASNARPSEASAYADAVTTYLGLAMSRITDRHSTMATWDSSTSKEQVRGTFARQAISMSWGFAEANPLTRGSGSLEDSINYVVEAVRKLPARRAGKALQADASAAMESGRVISTDPPYYDNIGYSDLSDYFYIWLRQSLRNVHPDLFRTLLVPKAEELVANPYRHGGTIGAKDFFEGGFRSVFKTALERTSADFPMTVYYAFKQSESNAAGTASTGWETLLEGMVRGGWMVTATWPVRSELSNRIRASNSNALASSIVLALRPRPEESAVVDRREFRDELLAELPGRLRELQQVAIAPVDLAQAAIGPGMAVYSRYGRVLEPDGSPLTVRQALAMINAVLDEVLSDQEGDHDPITRWCIRWFGQFGFNEHEYGTAETLASAMNTSVATVQRSGAIRSGSGKVTLLAPEDFTDGYRPDRDDVVTAWEITLQAAAALERGGLDEASRIVSLARERIQPQSVKDLAYLCFALCEKRKDAESAQLYNNLVTSWPEVTAQLSSLEKAGAALPVPLQGSLDLEDTPWR